MKLKTFFIYILLIKTFVSLLSCNNSNFKSVINNKKDSVIKFGAIVFDISKLKILVCNLNNKDSIFYIPKDSWISNIGDTIYVEAIYKRRHESDKIISYNQFNPPELEKLEPNSSSIKKINYKDLTIKSPIYLAIRLYRKIIPYDPKKDYVKYHSITDFISYEKDNSSLIYVRITNIDNLQDW